MNSDVRRKNITFDNVDAKLQYAGFWFHTGTWNASSVHQSGTLSSSNDPQANVTFTFPQPAVAFYYYGIARSKGALYAICIDCDPNAPRFDPVDGLNRTDDGTNPPIVLYSRVFDTPGQHVVILTNQNDSRGNPPGNSQITIDRFDLEIIDDTPLVTVTSPRSPINSSSSSPSGSPTPIGAIIGGAIGGFFAAVVLIGIGLLCLRRRRRRREVENGDSSPPHPSVEPYPATFRQPNDKASNPASTTSPAATSPSSGSSPYFSTVISSEASSSGAPSSRSYTDSSYTTSSRGQSSSRRSRRARRHETDAGPAVVEEEDGEDEETLPPLYEQVFRGGRQNRSSSARDRRSRASSSYNNNNNSNNNTLTPLEPLAPVRREKS